MFKEKLLPLISKRSTNIKKDLTKEEYNLILLFCKNIDFSHIKNRTDNFLLKLKLYHYCYNLQNIPKCNNCNIQLDFNPNRIGIKYGKYCSTKCCNSDSKKLQQMKDTSIKKYGTTCPLQSKDVKAQTKITNLLKYGNEVYQQTDDYKNKVKTCRLNKTDEQKELEKEKQRQTVLKRYGVDNIFKRTDIIQKAFFKKYNVTNPQHVKQFKEKSMQKSKKIFFKKVLERITTAIPLFDINQYEGVTKYVNYPWKCKICNKQFEDWISCGYQPSCPFCKPVGTNIELILRDFLIQYNIKFIERTRQIIPPLEIDFFLPDFNIGIELHGLVWHSELYGKTDKNYHLNKHILCKKRGILLFQFFSDEILFKFKQVSAFLKAKLNLNKIKIPARKCEIKEIDFQTKHKFIEKYHLQGDTVSSVALGLFYKSRLIQVMTFGKQRPFQQTKEIKTELIRVCTMNNVNVIGGFSKLLSYYYKKYSPNVIITYCDCRYSSGNVYIKNNFTFKHQSQPGYYYIKNEKRYHRYNFAKHLLHKKLPVFDKTLTEWQNMQLNKFDRIWDCGQYVYEKRF